MALDKITSDSITPGAVNTTALPDGAITSAKLHTTAISDKLGYTPVSPTDLSNGLSPKADTSTVNTALTLKAPLASPTFTGDVAINSTTSVKLPSGTTAERPSSIAVGCTRFNTSLNCVEVYTGTQWISLYDGIVSTPAYASAGGTISTSGSWRIHTFTSSSSITFSQAGRVQLLVVAGGGGGGWDVPGGGGAGGVVYSKALPVSASTYNITIGAGGTQGSASGRGGVGGNSAFGSIIAFGGGGGGSWNYTGPSEGGSGGGADGQNNYYTRSGARALQLRDQYDYCVGYGNRGGNGGGSRDSYSIGGGGGGAGFPGRDGDNGTIGVSTWAGDTNVCNGGDGMPFDISGTSTYYGGGGGGASNNFTVRGQGGLGGGGAAGTAQAAVPGSGTVNTGGGGGGGETTGGGTGGSGIVIVRYLS